VVHSPPAITAARSARRYLDTAARYERCDGLAVWLVCLPLLVLLAGALRRDLGFAICFTPLALAWCGGVLGALVSQWRIAKRPGRCCGEARRTRRVCPGAAGSRVAGGAQAWGARSRVWWLAGPRSRPPHIGSPRRRCDLGRRVGPVEATPPSGGRSWSACSPQRSASAPSRTSSTRCGCSGGRGDLRRCASSPVLARWIVIAATGVASAADAARPRPGARIGRWDCNRPCALRHAPV
jgi:hypothetical protein